MRRNAYCRIYSFRVLRQSFCGKFKLSVGSGDQRNLLLECIHVDTMNVTPIGANWKGYFHVFRGAISDLIKSTDPVKSAIRAKNGWLPPRRTPPSKFALLVSLDQSILIIEQK